MRAEAGRARLPARPPRRRLLLGLLAFVAAGAGCGGEAADRAGHEPPTEVLVGLVTKTADNPFWRKMEQGARSNAARMGVELRTYTGRSDGDVASQLHAIDRLIEQGATGILITPSDSTRLVPALRKARAAGILTIALDTPPEPAGAVDATFATDNEEAGRLVGRWARVRLGRRRARVGMLDLNPKGITVDVARNQGFLSGFGVDVRDRRRIGDERDRRIVGHEVTDGSVGGGRRAMQRLLERDPDINVVYAVNEPAAAGARRVLVKHPQSRDVVVVAIDGGCAGIEDVRAGRLDATAQQYPLEMAARGIEAVVRFAESGDRPRPTAGRDFVNTGVRLVTADPQPAVPSVGVGAGLANCWG
jgi:fructose transport system substrate-binding protein